MKDELVAILYQAARDVVEAIGDQAFVDMGEVQNDDTKQRMNQLRYAVNVIKSHKPKYAKPFVATFVDDAERWNKAFKTDFEADVAVYSYLVNNPSIGVTAAYYQDRRKLWE